jgi:3,5-epimerase/4-reductase
MEDGIEQHMQTFIENRVLIFGAKGWIGQKVVSILNRSPSILVFCAKSRADDADSVKSEIDTCGATHVMSFIGRTHGEGIGTIDYLEKPGKLVENLRDNLFAPLTLADVCAERGIHYTYLGTGCIFDYDDAHPFGDETTGFKTTDVPNFFGSSYSVVKGYTDRLMRRRDHVLNVRIRMPITDEVCPRNFITKITSYARVCSIPNSMTVLNDLLPTMIDLALKKQTGTVNLVNPGLITHNEILDLYSEIVDPTFTWTNFTIEEQNRILASNNCLDTSDKAIASLPHIKDSVRRMLIQMKMRIIEPEPQVGSKDTDSDSLQHI